MSMARLTESEYWDAGYADQEESVPLRIDSFRHRGEREIVALLESVGLSGRSVLEVGAGNSAVLAFLAARYRQRAEFSGLDYSSTGCAMLARRAVREQVAIAVLNHDLFGLPPDLLDRFDVVYSLGVVEHFSDLSAVLRTKKALLAPGGRMVTVIPNMAGLLGTLARRWNPEVYRLHVPHDLSAFEHGHVGAGLDVTSSGYLCSNNFGVLSACFRSSADPGWTSYMWLTRITKAVWRLEEAIGDMPRSARFSPYLFAVSRHEG